MEQTKPTDSKLLTIVIPTYNHPDYINFYLGKISFSKKNNIRVEIHDSSTDDSTKLIVEKFQKEYDNLFYYHYDNVHVDIKTIESLAGVNTKYVFLCGDGVIPNFTEHMYSNIEKYMEKDFDIIEIYELANMKHFNYHKKMEKKYGTAEIVYNDVKKYARDNMWHTPFYGGTIIKSEVFKQYTIDNMEQYISSGFVYPYMIYKYNYGDSFKGVSLRGDYLINNPCKKESLWVSKEKIVVKLWAHNYPEIIKQMELFSSKEVVKEIRNSEANLKFITAFELLRFKLSDNFSFNIFKRYKKDLLMYSPSFNISLYLVALFPKKVLVFLRKVKKMIKK